MDKITDSELKRMQRFGEPLILEIEKINRFDFPTLWIFFKDDVFLIVRYDDGKYNHIVIDHVILDSVSDISSVFDAALNKITDGACYAWSGSGTAFSISECKRRHNDQL